jgi:hypothetical protein
MDFGARATTESPFAAHGTFPPLKSANFPHIEIILIFASNVSSRRLRRNNSPAHETIFSFACRRPETFVN